MSEPVNKYNQDQLTTIDTVGQAKLEGVDLEKEEKHALWRLACGGLPVDAYLGEDD